MGYNQAGFEVVGVDKYPKPRYPFPFILGDAIDVLMRMIVGEKFTASDGNEYGLDDFVAIHASPPCQRYSNATPTWARANHPDLIGKTRDVLVQSGKPYIIENVPGAPLEGNVIMLCGTYFGLKVYRHRFFETSFFLLQPSHVPHHDNLRGSGRGVSRKGFMTVTGNGGGGGVTLKMKQSAIGIDWMTNAELSQAIPPAYTRWIGEQLVSILIGEKDDRT